MTERILTVRKCPSVEKLTTLKDVTSDDAKAIRHAWRTIGSRGEARAAVDRILRTYGVEFLGFHRGSGDSVHYCNAGDTYAGTILFIGARMVVGCWGDLVERNAIREVNATDPD